MRLARALTAGLREDVPHMCKAVDCPRQEICGAYDLYCSEAIEASVNDTGLRSVPEAALRGAPCDNDGHDMAACPCYIAGCEEHRDPP